MTVHLRLPREIKEALWAHLLPGVGAPEQAAFVFAEFCAAVTEGFGEFKYLEWLPVSGDGFESHSPFHMELSDSSRAMVIKRAHDLGASITEFHSHVGHWPAEFSPSDWVGFEEFVPHVWWRLKGRPYAAVVVAPRGFDAFAWVSSPDSPIRLGGIQVDDELLEPTRLSPLEKDGYEVHED
jgi:hypothetical protein